jgi:protein-S-isoprenylcysteine O-methyltransferase Ste14
MSKSPPSSKPDISNETQREIRKWIIQSALGLLGYGLILFLSAGELGWVWGWVFMGSLTVFLAAHPLILIPINPELLAEREQGLRDPRVKSWDRWITPLAAGVFPMASWVVAGLDLRFGWSGAQPLLLHLGGSLGVLLGYVLFLWAMACNAYFAEGVRIQTERGHKVAEAGPYRWVRHPGYAGAILAILTAPFLLGSPWAAIPALAAGALYVLRTTLEDKTLMDELPGYKDYARRTRYRLLPGLW